ncbi:MAG TPA: cupin domain-containing protein [Phaeodactylibacter sp.]|nr:cupin domain-containing protein [Phaeodactylibacter sp.]
MIYKKIKNIPEFLAGDHTHLKEVLHPHHDQLDLGFSLAHAYLDIGEKSLPHQLAYSETYYILEGKGVIFTDKKKQNIEKGDVIFVPAHAEQFVENTGTTAIRFLCIVSPAWTADSEKIK